MSSPREELYERIKETIEIAGSNRRARGAGLPAGAGSRYGGR